MADKEIKRLAEDMAPWDFEETAFTKPPELGKATVAIVSTASLHHEGQENFAPRDTGYREIAS